MASSLDINVTTLISASALFSQHRMCMDLFDVPFMTIDRPSVFNINDFWPEKDLPWITEFIITTAYETEKESLAELTPDEFYPEIHDYVKGGREFLEALSNDVDIPDSGGKLFTVVGALITLIIRTELAFDDDSGIGVISSMNAIKH